MRNILLVLLLICSVNATEKEFNINDAIIYKGCKDILSDTNSKYNWYVFGLAVAKKDATLDLMEDMSMLTVNGVDIKRACKLFLNLAKKDDFASKFLKSSSDLRWVLTDLIERQVIQSNGEDLDKFRENRIKMRKLFRKKN